MSEIKKERRVVITVTEGEPWATIAWALAGAICGPVALWIVREICMAALAAMAE